MYQNETECCGTCRFHKNQYDDWVCTNMYSDSYSDYTEYKDGCEEWEERN